MSRSSIHLISWNVNGIRAIMKKGFGEWLDKTSPDVLCLQETKATREQVEADTNASRLLDLEHYHNCWFSAEKKGYSGVATFSKEKPAKIIRGFDPDSKKLNFNNEGRLLITEFEQFELWNVYFPNGGRGPERVQYKLKFYDYCLDIWEKRRKEKKLVICGDFNTAHKEIDLARPKENQKNSGFLPEERVFLDKLLSMGYVDIFRKFDQSASKYTYWDNFRNARDRNVGWRIDYFIVTEETEKFVKNAYIDMSVIGSDHCPIGLELSFK